MGWRNQGANMTYIEKLISTNEQILLKQRMHWAALLMTIRSSISALISLAVVYLAYNAVANGSGLLARFVPPALSSQFQPLLTRVPAWLPLVIFGLLALNVLWQLLWGVLNWMNSMNIVTSRRVIQVHGVLSKSSIDSSLEKVNDVLLEQSWLGRILSYGHLNIMTASETGLNTMRFLPDPIGFKRAVLDSKQNLSDTGALPTARAAAPAALSIAERLQELQKLKDMALISEEEFTAKREQLLAEV
jgi:uncharacterized membrane protein YdbT with pleckstrin-like domain